MKKMMSGPHNRAIGRGQPADRSCKPRPFSLIFRATGRIERVGRKEKGQP
jgi:hypothetical protein